MNERIQELLFESNIFAKNSDGKVDTTKVHLNKFAELIVKECWALVDFDNKQYIKAQFKEHFGVEE